MEVSMKLFSAALFSLLFITSGLAQANEGYLRKCDCEKTELTDGGYTLFYSLITVDESGSKVYLMKSEVNHSPYDEVIQLGRCELALRKHDACK
jgi:hypothetical protein